MLRVVGERKGTHYEIRSGKKPFEIRERNLEPFFIIRTELAPVPIAHLRSKAREPFSNGLADRSHA